MADSLLHARQGDTLEGLIWRERRLDAGALGGVLEANRGLADLGPVLPIGTPVALPAVAPIAAALPLIQLWD